MDATIIRIADAVVDTLNGISEIPGAVRAYRPVYDLEKDMGQLRVTVIPSELTLTAMSRSADDHEYAIDVAIQRRVASVKPVDVDPFMALVERVVDAFRGKSLATLPEASCVGAANRPIFGPANLDEHGVFTSLVSLTFRVARARP